jgi:hypothetical protein
MMLDPKMLGFKAVVVADQYSAQPAAKHERVSEH